MNLKNQKLLRNLTFLFGYLFIGIFISKMIQNIDILADVNVKTSVALVKIVLGAFLQKSTLILSIIFLIMFYSYHRTYDIHFNIRFNPSKIINFFLYLYISTFFIIGVPGIYLSFALFSLCVLTAGHNRNQVNMRPFWIIILGFVVIELIEIITSGIGIREVKKDIKIGIQATWMIPYLNAFAFYYVVKNRNWQCKEFETFFKIIMYCSVVVGLESLVIFYMGIGKGISVFGNSPLFRGTMFQSSLVGQYHTVGRLGIMLFFMSLYFFQENQNRKYLLFALLGFLLVLSTMNRQASVSLILGTLLYVLITTSRSEDSKSYTKVLQLYFSMIMLIAFVLILIGIVNYVTIVREDVSSAALNHLISATLHLKRRIIRWAHGIDIFIYTFPFGTGAGMVTYYMGSSIIPWNFCESVGYFFGYDSIWINKLIVSKKAIITLGIEAGYTIHNLWFRTILEFGILGLIFVCYIWWKGWRMFALLFSVKKNELTKVQLNQAWAVFFMVFSISLSVMFTVKFRNYWYFGLIFAFLELSVNNACNTISKTK